MKKFEMAHSDQPEEIIMATQRSLVDCMLSVLADLKKNDQIKQPGLTWEQIEFFLMRFREKQPEVIFQEAPV